jgi:hypothetical protein
MVRDADGGAVALDVEPFVVFGVVDCHGFLLVGQGMEK